MSKKILTVDDSASIRQMVTFTLKQAGYEVVEAEDGVQGLSKAQAEAPHLIITDLNMPNMNGIEMIKGIRQQPQHKFTPILMLTTESDDSKKAEGKQAGATGWIVKPFNPEQLIKVIQKVMPA
ncbi:MAG: response regulator [Pseudomonadota bacterium]|nr:two-component system response regulator [Magnetococcales bacterium]MEC8066832.1 response regulator [Pseudomonadota bacterium]MEC8467843.1 response regulator [Pseudomonadota bacterium]|tara:strand:- start:15924 stop:16292 length:369 start_codon:yes stop_codon:yes gene_type:complete